MHEKTGYSLQNNDKHFYIPITKSIRNFLNSKSDEDMYCFMWLFSDQAMLILSKAAVYPRSK